MTTQDTQNQSTTRLASRQNQNSVRQKWPLAAVIVLAGAALVGGVFLASAAMRGMASGGKAMSEQEFAAVTVGQSVVFALEVTERPSDSQLIGRLLERGSDGVYRRTSRQVTVQSGADTSVVMGQPSDLQSGAVLQVNGTVTALNAVQAQQFVVLSGYVSVQ